MAIVKRSKPLTKVTWVDCFKVLSLRNLSPNNNYITKLPSVGWEKERLYSQAVMVTWIRWPPWPYMLKTLKHIRTNERTVLKLGMLHWDSSTTSIIWMRILGWPWPFLWQGPTWSPRRLNWKSWKSILLLLLYFVICKCSRLLSLWLYRSRSVSNLGKRWLLSVKHVQFVLPPCV